MRESPLLNAWSLSSPLTLVIWALLAVLFVRFTVRLCLLGSREKGLPPGPPTKWGLGNAAMFLEIFNSLDWGKEYGDLYSLKVFGSTVVILNHPSAIKAILDKQGAKTGNRPEFHIGEKMIPNVFIGANMDTPLWKSARKVAHMFLHEESFNMSWPAQRKEIFRFLNCVLSDPKNLFIHVKQSSLSVNSVHLYGTPIPDHKSQKSEEYFAVCQLVDQTMDPTAHPPVDLIPILKYVPKRWAKWKRTCDEVSSRRKALYDKFYDDGKKAFERGERTGSCLERLLIPKAETWKTLDKSYVAAALETLMEAGIEATTSVMHTAILAFLNFPECLERVQKELDEVIGRDRLPTLEDLKQLPYFNAFLKEVFRFRPVVPFGIPHVATEDATYKDYIIPKGSMIMPNLWVLYHDNRFFDKPELFNPERYLKSLHGLRLDLDPALDVDGFRDNLTFGSGRRICPGEALATRMFSIHLLYIAWAFNLAKENEHPTIHMSAFFPYQPGHAFRPKPFTCRVTVRDERCAALIRDIQTTDGREKSCTY